MSSSACLPYSAEEIRRGMRELMASIIERRTPFSDFVDRVLDVANDKGEPHPPFHVKQ